MEAAAAERTPADLAAAVTAAADLAVAPAGLAVATQALQADTLWRAAPAATLVDTTAVLTILLESDIQQDFAVAMQAEASQPPIHMDV
jgi:hypothetical protein